MAEESGTAGTALDTLKDEEIAILKKALRRVEQDLFDAVIKRLKVLVLMIAGLLTIFGVASLATLRNAAVEGAASRLAADAVVRDEVVSVAAQKLESVNEVLQRSAALEKKIEAEETRALIIVREDLGKILTMVQQIERDLALEPKVANAEP
jgi:hypothetical protein